MLLTPTYQRKYTHVCRILRREREKDEKYTSATWEMSEIRVVASLIRARFLVEFSPGLLQLTLSLSLSIWDNVYSMYKCTKYILAMQTKSLFLSYASLCHLPTCVDDFLWIYFPSSFTFFFFAFTFAFTVFVFLFSMCVYVYECMGVSLF